MDLIRISDSMESVYSLKYFEKYISLPALLLLYLKKCSSNLVLNLLLPPLLFIHVKLMQVYIFVLPILRPIAHILIKHDDLCLSITIN